MHIYVIMHAQKHIHTHTHTHTYTLSNRILDTQLLYYLIHKQTHSKPELIVSTFLYHYISIISDELIQLMIQVYLESTNIQL